MKCPMNGERVCSKPSFVEASPNCPRCGCSNTKFCYYNNYSLTQPRFFCKGCRRYWTKGGSLREVPVGGGCRKNRRHVATTKSLRVSMDSKTPNNSSIGKNVIKSSLSSSSSSSVLHDDGSHIDIALVYANFLSQEKPNSINNEMISDNNGSQVHELLGVDDHFDPCFEFSSNIGHQLLVQENKSQEDHFIASDDFGLLLLPHCYLPDQEEPLLWSNSQHLVVGQSAMQASCEEDPLLVGPQEDLLNGNWSPF